MRYLVLLLFLFACEQNSGVVSQETSDQEQIQELENSTIQIDKPYVVLISLDGFRYDYAKKYGAENLLNFEAKAERMIPSFPSKTFPNHYTIVTGLYPGNNGLVSNEFFDRDLNLVYSIGKRSIVENANFYSGNPLWVLAAKQNMVSASMFWVGSEATIKNVLPTYYFKYNKRISHQDRVNKVIEWLKLPEKKRPHLITLYFSTIDDLGHAHGPDSKEVSKGVKEIDKTLGDLINKIDNLCLPVNIIVVSDHGMVEVDSKKVIYPEQLFPSDMITTTSFPAMVYSDDTTRIDSIYHELIKDTTKYSLYLRSKLPKRYHYNNHLNRIGDLILMPKPPYTLGKIGYKIEPGASTHGYDPADTPEMGAIFYATGPAFKKSSIPAFENIHVYPLIAKILGLDYERDSIDGRIEVLDYVLTK